MDNFSLPLVGLLLVVLLVLAALIFVFPYDFTWLFRPSDVKLIEKLPGPKPIPYFGNVLLFNKPHEEIIKTMFGLHNEYGSLYRIWVVGFPEVMLSDPDDVEILLSSRNYITKGMEYELLLPWLGLGLLTSDGERWHSHRKILTPAFHFKILEDFIQVFNANSSLLVDILAQRIDEPYVAMSSLVKNCTLDIICESAMGVSVNAQKGESSEYINAVHRNTEMIVNRQMQPWMYRDALYELTPQGREHRRLFNILHGFTEKVIKERREEYRANLNATDDDLPKKRRRLAFLDVLIEASEKEGVLTDSDIREEVDTFMFEGHDTTSVALLWIFLLLGSHPEVQEKVVDELREIFGDSTRDATYSDLQRMVYLEQVIKEALRLYPSVPGISRKLASDFVTSKNYTIPSGTNCAVLPVVMHRNPRYFPDPDRFNPDNFSPERVKDRHPFAYIPFSAGPRNCIGQRFAMLEEKTAISSVLRKFKIESLDKPEDNPPMFELILRPKNEVRLKLTLR